MDPLSWAIIGICVFLHFFFSAGETALASANQFKFQVKADDGSKSAKLVLKVCDDYERILSTLLLGSNIAAISASAVSTVAFYNLLINIGVGSASISLISSVIISLIIYIFGDALPKTIAKIIPDTISSALIYPIYWFSIILFPLSFLFDKLAVLFAKLFKVKEEESIDQEEFENVVEKVSDEGVLDEEQSDIIQSALDFVDTNVKEVLTPREKVFAIDANELDREKLHDIIVNSTFSRIPVYKGNLDNIIGVLYVKNYFKLYMNNPDVRLSKCVSKPYFVSPSIMMDDLFNGFKKSKTHMAIVRDKSYKVLGIITMDDVLEELVSDISETESKGNK